MTALPQNTTSRWFLDYLSNNQPTGQEHTMSLRLSTNGSASAANAKFLQLLTAMGVANLRAGWRPIRLRYQAALSDFSLPVAMVSGLSSFLGTASIAGYNVVQETIQYSWAARSVTTGRRAAISVFVTPTAGLNALRSVAAPWATTVVSALNDNTNGAVICVDGSEVEFYPYMNINANSYWEREMRA
jgi:hypothetical protein